MSYLLSVAIGPVQPFIEAARRTADLQAGSSLLVRIAQAVAKSISLDGGELIFPPHPEGDGPNKVLAILPQEPAQAADRAREAAQGVIASNWESMRESLATSGANGIDWDAADQQLKDFVEFYAAWVPLGEDYAAARTAVERLLAGRKALRDFAPPSSLAGIPKSALDPSRDSVLTRDIPRGGPPFYLKPAEHLDAMALIKRWLGRQAGPVPSTTELAARPLLRQLAKTNSDGVQGLRQLAEAAGSGVAVADLLYPGRRHDARKAGELSEEQEHEAQGFATEILGAAEPPDWASYYAILVADGDRMGMMLNRIAAHRGKEGHVELGRALSRFARDAWNIVARHAGHMVYSGGDDVLALLPADAAIPCASELANGFAQHMEPWAAPGYGNLSVGVAIVHHLEPLRISLERARAAEREAKRDRNSLAVALHSRGGPVCQCVESWSDGSASAEWSAWTDGFRKRSLSRGLPYELRQLALEAGDVLTKETLRAEAQRILARKRPEGGSAAMPPAELAEALKRIESATGLAQLAQKLTVCRFLAQFPEA